MSAFGMQPEEQCKWNVSRIFEYAGRRFEECVNSTTYFDLEGHNFIRFQFSDVLKWLPPGTGSNEFFHYVCYHGTGSPQAVGIVRDARFKRIEFAAGGTDNVWTRAGLNPSPAERSRLIMRVLRSSFGDSGIIFQGDTWVPNIHKACSGGEDTERHWSHLGWVTNASGRWSVPPEATSLQGLIVEVERFSQASVDRELQLQANLG